MWSPYAQSTGSITDARHRLQQHLEQVPARLNALSEKELLEQAPGKWSRKEILGHLIDSALNNLKRFTDAQFAGEVYQIQGYNQTNLVAVNRYQELPLSHLIALWSALNTQILYVTGAMAAEKLAQPVQFESDETAAKRTLGWLIEDYVAHLEHHLRTL